MSVPMHSCRLSLALRSCPMPTCSPNDPVIASNDIAALVPRARRGRCAANHHSTMLVWAVLAASAAMGLWAAPASGASAATVTLRPARIQPGGTVILAASGFPARRAGKVALGSTFTRALRTDGRGAVRRSLVVPRSTSARSARMLVRIGRRRVALTLRVVRKRESEPSVIAAVSSGESVFVTPATVSSGKDLRLLGDGFTPGGGVSVLARGPVLARVRASRAGRFTLAVPTGLQTFGLRSLEVRSGRRQVLVPVTVLSPPPNPPPLPVGPIAPVQPAPVTPPPTPPPSPVLAAGGDVACDPTSANFNAGDGIDLGDGKGPRCFQKATAQALQSINPDAVAVLGDEQYELGSLAQFNGSFGPSWGPLGPKLKPVPGNHEYMTPNAQGYFDYFNGASNATGRAGDRTKGYYSYDLGAWHVVALNSECAAPPSPCSPAEELSWLEADLTNWDASHPGASCVLAYWHKALFSSAANPPEAPEMAPFWQKLQNHRADVILSGHAHSYERFAPQRADRTSGPDGIAEFVVGSGGEEHLPFDLPKPNSVVRNANQFGVLRLTLQASSFDWSFVSAGPRPAGEAPFTDADSAQCH